LAPTGDEELPEYRRQSSENDHQVEEQTVSIPGEEDLPIRTPTPEVLGIYFFPLPLTVFVSTSFSLQNLILQSNLGLAISSESK
jgi:hypothetical protein